MWIAENDSKKVKYGWTRFVENGEGMRNRGNFLFLVFSLFFVVIQYYLRYKYVLFITIAIIIGITITVTII